MFASHLLVVVDDPVNPQGKQTLRLFSAATSGKGMAPLQLCNLDGKMPRSPCCCRDQNLVACRDTTLILHMYVRTSESELHHAQMSLLYATSGQC